MSMLGVDRPIVDISGVQRPIFPAALSRCDIFTRFVGVDAIRCIRQASRIVDAGELYRCPCLQILGVPADGMGWCRRQQTICGSRRGEGGQYDDRKQERDDVCTFYGIEAGSHDHPPFALADWIKVSICRRRSSRMRCSWLRSWEACHIASDCAWTCWAWIYACSAEILT